MSEQNMENPYEVPDKELLERLMRATGGAGVAASGLCYDFTAGYQIAKMHFYKGVVLARLAGKKPPYKPGEQVAVCVEAGLPALESNAPYLRFEHEHVVSRVWYIRGDWYLELKDNDGEGNPPKYQAIGFKPLKVEAT